MENLKRLILHVGQHKTGSKALQSFLATNREALAREGVLYPEGSPSHLGSPAYRDSHYLLFAHLRHEISGHTGPRPPACGDSASSRDWLAIQAARPEPVIVVSAEDLFEMSTAHELGNSLSTARGAADALSRHCRALNLEAKVCVYLRRQDHLLAAHYVQYIKGPSRGHLDFHAFARQSEWRGHALPFLQVWAEHFGTNGVTVRPYEQESQSEGIVGDFFSQVLKLPLNPGFIPAPAGPEQVNRSLGRDLTELLRILNKEEGGAAVVDRFLARPDLDGPPRGAAAWLSPSQRRQLLQSYEEENLEIARLFLCKKDCLFHEPWPSDDEAWRPYPGLSAERAVHLLLSCPQEAPPLLLGRIQRLLQKLVVRAKQLW